MAWFVLVLSGSLEAVWATAMSRSEGFTRLWPSVIFLIGLASAMAGLSYAMRTLPLGTSYAVFVGVGSVLAVTVSMATGQEALSIARILLLGGIIACIVGLRVVT